MSHICSPLRYPGGKNCIFPFVSNLFHENRLIGISYAEPYAGGAGLALRLLFEEYVDHIYINDLDRSIYAFWYAILNHTDAFCRWLEGIDPSMENWYLYKSIQQAPTDHTFFELAKSTFFLNRTNVSGVIKGGVIGGYEQKGKYKIDARFNKKDLVKRIRRIEEFKKRITLSNLDGLAFVRRIDKKTEKIFIYLDPPYYKKGADLYMNFYSEKDHKKLSLNVHKIKKRWMVSYDHHEFILNLYAEKKKILYQLSQSASNRIGDEVLIFADQMAFKNSMNSLSSPMIINS
jgi:DNA adenine methylase